MIDVNEWGDRPLDSLRFLCFVCVCVCEGIVLPVALFRHILCQVPHQPEAPLAARKYGWAHVLAAGTRHAGLECSLSLSLSVCVCVCVSVRSFYEAYVLYLLFYVMPVLFMGGETNTMTKLHIRHKLRDPRTYPIAHTKTDASVRSVPYLGCSYVLTTKLMFMFLMAFGPAVNLIHYAVQQRRGGEALWVEEALLILDILVMIAVLVNALQVTWRERERERERGREMEWTRA